MPTRKRLLIADTGLMAVSYIVESRQAFDIHNRIG
jgi:hypothetical protein